MNIVGVSYETRSVSATYESLSGQKMTYTIAEGVDAVAVVKPRIGFDDARR